jgi:hypothetical protein
MTKERVEELPSAAKRLLRMERHAAGPSAEVADRLRRRVSRTIAGEVSAAQLAAAPARSKVSLTLIVGLALAVTGGAASLLASRPGRSTVSPRGAPAPTPGHVPATETTATLPSATRGSPKPSTPFIRVSRPETAPTLVSRPGTGRRPSPADVVAEAEVLERGRQSLDNGDADDALVAVATHEKRWRSGVLTPEREALAISALAARGDTGQAEERATRFLARFPHSTLAPRVRALVGKAPDGSNHASAGGAK